MSHPAGVCKLAWPIRFGAGATKFMVHEMERTIDDNT